MTYTMYFVYAIYNKKHDKFYIGQTESLDARLEIHNSQVFKNSYTSRYDGVWEIFYSEEYLTRKEALAREKQLKSFRGREFIKETLKKFRE
mgnify:CR=1 FL=1